MGLISKLEEKIAGSDKIEEPKKLEKQQQQGVGSYQQGMTSNPQGYGTSQAQSAMSSGEASKYQHPISSATGTGSGITGGTAVTGGYGSEALTGGSHGYGREGNVSSTSDQLRDTHLGSSTGSEGPRQPFNPYTSKGQQIAANAGSSNTTYGASQGRAEAGDIGSRRSADDPEVRRTQHGGISNNMTAGQTFTTGEHSQLENRDAVPTAGGHRVGSGTAGAYDSSTSSQSQHHYGRDAALAGGAGAAGYGAYEATQGRDNGPAPNTAGPHRSDMMNKIDPRVEADPSKSQYGRDSGVSGVDSRTTTSSSSYPDSTTRSSYEQSGVDRRTYDTSSAGKYGQDVSYMNRPAADQPLTHSQDFSERHPHSSTVGAAGAGAGAGALGASAMSHRDQETSGSRNVSDRSYAGQPSSTTGYSSSQPGVAGAKTSSTAGSDDHATRGSEMAKRMGGAYESGYRDGYRDAMAHKASAV